MPWRLEEYYGLAHGTLLVQWLSDRIVFEMGEEDLAIEAISLAEMKNRVQIGRTGYKRACNLKS